MILRIRFLSVIATGLILIASAIPSSACFFPFWPMGWGGGYGYGGPGYGYGAPGYGYGAPAPYAAPMYGSYWGAPAAPVYSVGYAGYSLSGGCCVPACCDPCSSCGSVGCATGACDGAVTSGTMKPSEDRNFSGSSTGTGTGTGTPAGPRTFGSEYDNDPNRGFRDPMGTGNPETGTESNTPAAGSGTDGFRRRDPGQDTQDSPMFTDPPAGTGAPAGTSGDSDFPGLIDFGAGRNGANKPPMNDPVTGGGTGAAAPGGSDAEATPGEDDKKSDETPATFEGGAAPTEDGTFLPATGEPSTSTLLHRSLRLASHREVLKASRIANRGVTRQASRRSSETLEAGNHAKDRPIRWISLPMDAGHARL